RDSQDPILRAVAELIKHPKVPLAKVVLSNCKLNSEDALDVQVAGLGFMIRALQENSRLPEGFQLKELDLSDNELACAVRYRAEKRRQEDKPIQDLLMMVQTISLQGNEIGFQDLGGLLPSLTADAKVRDIKLGDNILDDTGAVELATELSYNRELRKLDLRNATLSSKGIFALTNCFTPNHKLTHLNLSFNNVGADGASAIAHMVSIYPQLTSLDVTSAEIPSKGVQEIMKALMTSPCQLHTLKIGDNVLDNKAGEEVAQFLSSRSSSRECLRALDLGSRSAFTPGFEACDLLKNCRARLQELVFRGENLELEDRCKFIFVGCRQCSDLASLDAGLIKIDMKEGSR
ncbi:unnamed protein product, partial [Prorocentrum cordatum]